MTIIRQDFLWQDIQHFHHINPMTLLLRIICGPKHYHTATNNAYKWAAKINEHVKILNYGSFVQ